MIQAREALTDGYAVKAEDLRALLQEARVAEERAQRRLGRMARAASNTDSKVYTLSGVGLGILAGTGLATGIIPGAEMLTSINGMLPLASGAFFAAIGLLVGTYLDLHGVTNQE